jgi:hypothetical protein
MSRSPFRNRNLETSQNSQCSGNRKTRAASPRVLSRNKRSPSKKRKGRLRCLGIDCHRPVILEQTSRAWSSKPSTRCWRLICNPGEESSDLNLLKCRSVGFGCLARNELWIGLRSSNHSWMIDATLQELILTVHNCSMCACGETQPEEEK